MKRLATYIILAIAATIGLNSCSHNNGDIGYWFGLWHLDYIEVNGTPVPDYEGNTYFMFQGKVFCIRCVYETHHAYDESYAQWQENDDHQSATITFADDRFPPTINSLIPLETVTTFNVVTLNDKVMVIKHIHSETGTTHTYYLTRWE